MRHADIALSYCIYRLFTMTLFFFFFNDTATTEIYTLSLHDALPISPICVSGLCLVYFPSSSSSSTVTFGKRVLTAGAGDRKSTRLNSSHSQISYAVFCLKKKKIISVAMFDN